MIKKTFGLLVNFGGKRNKNSIIDKYCNTFYLISEIKNYVFFISLIFL